MDRIIKKTQTLVVGSGAGAIAAAEAASGTGSQVAMLDQAAVQAPQGVEAVSGVLLDKIILYPEGRVAGVMGHQVSDGMKINTLLHRLGLD